MPLSLLSGPVGSGKTTQLLALLEQKLAGRSALYIVPSDTTASELRRWHLAHSDRPLLGEIFLSWPQFVRRLSGITTPIMSRIHMAMTIYQLLGSHDLRYFKPEAVSMGIAREFASTILSLKHNLVDPALLRTELATRGSLKENDLLTVYERYEDVRANHGIIDEGDVTMSAASNAAAGSLPSLDGIDTLIVDEFYILEPGVRSIITTLARTDPAIAVHLSLPRPIGSDATFAPMWMNAIAWFEPHADTHIQCTRDHAAVAPITATTTRSPSVEVRVLARRLLDCIEGNANPIDTCIAMRPDDAYLSHLLDECDRYGIIGSSLPTCAPMHAPLLHRLLAEETTADLTQRDTLEHHAEHMLEMLASWNIHARWRDDLSIDAQRFAVSRNAAAIARLEELLRSLILHARHIQLAPLSKQCFIDIIHEALSSSSSWISASSALPFSLQPFEVPPARSIRRSYIPHMVEGHIPQLSTERLFFNEMEDWGTSRSSILDDIFVDTERHLAREAATFHALHMMTDEELLLSYPAVNRAGSEVIPSSFLDAVDAVTYADIDPDIPEPPGAQRFEKILRHALVIERERERGHAVHPEYHGIVVDPMIRRMVRKRYTDAPIAPTSLERFASCPFQFMVEKVLNIKPEEEVTPEILPKDRGTIIHAVLERFFRDHAAPFRKRIAGSISAAQLKDIVEEIVDRVFLEHAALIGYASSSLDDYQRRSVTTLALQVILMEAEHAQGLPEPLLPTSFEWFFGERDRPALRIELPDDAPAHIKGRVDRVDCTADGSKFMIADYKTGRSVESVKKKIADGLHVQLPLYLLAAHQFLYPDAVPVGGMLIGVQQAEKKHGFLKKDYNGINYALSGRLATVLDGDAWQALLDTSVEATRSYVAEIRAARFPVAPRACTDFCDYKDICRYHEEID